MNSPPRDAFAALSSVFLSPSRHMSTHIPQPRFCQRALKPATSFLLAACALTASFSPLHAQNATLPNAASAKARLFDPASVSLRVLPNGVRGIVRETRGTGLVAVQVWVRAGSRYETNADAGASHLVETLVLESSKNYPRSNSAAGGGAAGAIEALGGTATSQTTRDAVNFGATVAAPFAPAAVRALSDAVLRPRLNDSDVEGAKVEIEAGLQRRAIDPIMSAADLAYAAAFAKHPYRRAANGTTQGVDALGGARVRAYHAARYVGSNISVVVVGDVRAATAHALIAQSFGGASATASQEPKIAGEKAPLAFKNVSRRGLISRGAVALGFRAPGIDAPKDVVAMDVLLSHWSEGRDAAMRRVLLGDADPDAPSTDASPDVPATPANTPEPLALAFDVGFLTQRDSSLLIISLVADPASRARAIHATLDEMARVRVNGLTAADLARAKAMLRRQYIQQGETVSGQAGALGFYDMIASYDFAVTYLDRIDRVSLADIKRVANTYLSGTNYVQVVIEPAARPIPRPEPPQQDDGSITA